MQQSTAKINTSANLQQDKFTAAVFGNLIHKTQKKTNIKKKIRYTSFKKAKGNFHTKKLKHAMEYVTCLNLSIVNHRYHEKVTDLNKVTSGTLENVFNLI